MEAERSFFPSVYCKNFVRTHTVALKYRTTGWFKENSFSFDVNFLCVCVDFPRFLTNTMENAENFSISETSRRIKPEFSDFFGIFSVLCCDVKVLSSGFSNSFSVLFSQLMIKVLLVKLKKKMSCLCSEKKGCEKFSQRTIKAEKRKLSRGKSQVFLRSNSSWKISSFFSSSSCSHFHIDAKLHEMRHTMRHFSSIFIFLIAMPFSTSSKGGKLSALFEFQRTAGKKRENNDEYFISRFRWKNSSPLCRFALEKQRKKVSSFSTSLDRPFIKSLFSHFLRCRFLNANVFNDATEKDRERKTVNEPLNIKQFIKTHHKKLFDILNMLSTVCDCMELLSTIINYFFLMFSSTKNFAAVINFDIKSRLSLPEKSSTLNLKLQNSGRRTIKYSKIPKKEWPDLELD